MADIEAVFARADADGYLHARTIDGGAEVGHRADELVVTASVFKVAVLVELTRRVSATDLSMADRILVPASRRTRGPTGISAMLDDVELSVRDLALLMMSVSDNTATDVLIERLGLDSINCTLRELGLEQTTLVGDCRQLLGSFESDVGVSLDDANGGLLGPEQLAQWRSLHPELTSRTTPREMTTLLSAIARNEAGPPDACAECIRIMALQVWPHRLTRGFPNGVRLAAKTGTLPGIRNEAGLVEYPDGSRYAVAVFTRAHSFEDRQPAIDAAIGDAAFLAIEQLRAS